MGFGFNNASYEDKPAEILKWPTWASKVFIIALIVLALILSN